MSTVTVQKRKRKTKVSYQVSYYDQATGKKKYYKTFQKSRDANRAANELRSLLDNGRQPERPQTITPKTFSDVSTAIKRDWDVRVRQGYLNRNTCEDYKIRLNALERAFGKLLLCELSKDAIIDHMTDTAERTSNVSANKDLQIIKQVMKKGLEMHAITANPAKDVRAFSEKEHVRNRFLMPGELLSLLDAAHKGRGKHYLPALILLGAEHGASKQECLSLQWSDIDFDYQDIGLIRFFRTKNGHERTEYLMPRTKAALLQRRDYLAWKRHRGNYRVVDTNLVFCRVNGTPIKQFRKAFNAACYDAGIKDFHFHDLRHTFCSNLILSGADLKDAKEMIGHADIAMTDRYTHLTAQHKLILQKQLTNHYAPDAKNETDPTASESPQLVP